MEKAKFNRLGILYLKLFLRGSITVSNPALTNCISSSIIQLFGRNLVIFNPYYQFLFIIYLKNQSENRCRKIAGVGSYRSSLSTFSQGMLFLTDTTYKIYHNQISGQVFKADSTLCQLDSSSVLLANIPIIASDGDQNFYGLTDSLGNYTIDLDTGIYNVRAQSWNDYWLPCLPDTIIRFDSSNVIRDLNFGLQATVDCPNLSVDIGNHLLRRCFSNNYYLHYCNTGTITASDAYVELFLDNQLQLDSASIPYIDLGNNIYRFDIDTLDINDCGTFRISMTPICDSTLLGQELCVEARIFPDSSCSPTTQLWSGADMEVTATCIQDSTEFTIRNIGTGTNRASLPYIVIVDDVVMRGGSYQLPPLGEETIMQASMGRHTRLETPQEPFHPDPQLLFASTVGCGTPMDSTIMGFLSLFPQYNGRSTTDIDCKEVVGSYDPNDKVGKPLGIGEDHHIQPNTKIEYKIRFQNTGNDTAFKVVIIDTLPETLDPASIRFGASSHPYTTALSRDGIVTFTFDPIALPDSTTNENASQGFVQFEIDQQPDLAPGTEIINTAGIYFDFNDPIITPLSLHTIAPLREFEILSRTICTPDEIPDLYLTNDTTLTTFISDATTDSIIITNVTVGQHILDTINLELTTGDQYNGVVYESDTAFTETYDLSSGCDSLLWVNISVQPVGISELVNSFPVRVFPNPADSDLHINFGKPLDTSMDIQLMTINGRIIREKRIAAGTLNTNLKISEFEDGIYLLKCESAHHRLYERIIIHR